MKLAALKGSPYFLNYNVDYLSPDDNLSMCCRLRLNYEELKSHSGGLWAIGDNTGSIGVVSLNMPRVGYLSRKNHNLWDNIDQILELARNQLKYKRRVIQESLDEGFLPTTRKMLNCGFRNHFNTIGIVGMHDFTMNLLDEPIYSQNGQKMVLEVLRYMREKLKTFQIEDRMLMIKVVNGFSLVGDDD